MQTFLRLGVGLALLLLALVAPSSCQADNTVENVRQNYQMKLNSQVVQQIHEFSKKILFYKAYASYFDRADVNLPGFKKLFMSLSEERLTTAENLTEIVNQRGGYVTFQNVKLRHLCVALSRKLARFPHVCYYVAHRSQNRASQARYKIKKNRPMKKFYKDRMTGNNSPQSTTPKMPTGLSALEDTLALERMTNKDLIDLMKFTVTMNDPAMRVKLDAHLEHQVDLIYRLSNLVTRLRLYQKAHTYTLGEYILDSEMTY